MTLVALEAFQPRPERRIDLVCERVQRRREHERQRNGKGRHGEPGRLEQPSADREVRNDQGELAVGREADRGEEARARTQPRRDEQQEEDDTLERQHHEQLRSVAKCRPGRRCADPDVQEEADEEQLLQAPEHVRELLRAAVIGEQHAEHERAELRAQTEMREALTAADREQRAE